MAQNDWAPQKTQSGQRNGVHEGYATSDGPQGKTIVSTGRPRRDTELAQGRMEPSLHRLQSAFDLAGTNTTPPHGIPGSTKMDLSE